MEMFLGGQCVSALMESIRELVHRLSNLLTDDKSSQVKTKWPRLSRTFDFELITINLSSFKLNSSWLPISSVLIRFSKRIYFGQNFQMWSSETISLRKRKERGIALQLFSLFCLSKWTSTALHRLNIDASDHWSFSLALLCRQNHNK